MKKYLKYILIISIFSFFQSCGKNTNQNDLEKINLKGDVILIKDGGEYIFFNEKGNIINKYNDYNPENLYIINYFYIDNRLSKTISLRKMSWLRKWITEKEQYNFNYDNNGQLINRNMEDESGVVNSYLFYDNGKLIKDSTYTDYKFKHLLVESFVYDGELLITRNRYDKMWSRGNVNDEPDFTRKYIYFYENGLIKKEINDEGKDLSYEYENDLKGNWIKQKKSNGEVWKREIFYKGDDISLYENKFEQLKKELSSSNSETNNNQDPASNNEVAPEENNVSEQSSTPQKQVCYDCKGTGKCPKCSVPQRVRYKQGETPNDHNEIRLGMIVCPQCGGNLMNWGSDKNKSCYLCKATGWQNCPKCNSNGNGQHIGQCQTCKGTGYRN